VQHRLFLLNEDVGWSRSISS